jgi:hypothetical protein
MQYSSFKSMSLKFIGFKCWGLLALLVMIQALSVNADSGNKNMSNTDSNVEREVTALIHDTAERWNSQDFTQVLELWDKNEPVPFYLAEEQDDWFIGWDALNNYLNPPRVNPVLQGLREEMHNIHVKQIAPGLAIAAWDMHFEMKMRGSKPIGEDVRVSAVLRKTEEGWRYIHWAESPMTATMYMKRLLEKNVDQEKFDVVHERWKEKNGAAAQGDRK